jgi:hypothetical protein
MSTKQLLWTGSGFILLALVTAVVAFAVQVAAILFAIFFGVLINGPALANGAKNFVQLNVPRLLSGGISIAVVLFLIGMLCFGEVIRRRILRFQIRRSQR